MGELPEKEKTYYSEEEYLLVDQFLCRVECYTRMNRDPGSWLYRIYESMEEVIDFPDLELKIPVGGLYEGVEFEEESE